MEEGNEKKEDFGFSKGGFETLNSELGQSDSDIPWYEQDKEKKEFVSPLLPSEEQNDETFASAEEEENGYVTDDWEEYGKIYLPDPPPPFAADKIRNEAEYLKDFFEKHKLKKKSGKAKAIGVCCSFICFVFCLFMYLSDPSKEISALYMMFAIVFLGFTIVFSLKRNAYKASDKFFLIRPYALKKLSGGGYIGERGRYYIDRYSELEKSGLKVYYQMDGKQRTAETDKIYSEKQLDIFIRAFEKGKLVVACKLSYWGDRALVCEPEKIRE